MRTASPVRPARGAPKRLIAAGLVLAAFACASPAILLKEGVTASDFASAEGFDWVRDTIGPVVVYAERGRYPAAHFDRIREYIEPVPERIEEVFGRSLPSEAIHVFVLGSNEDMDRLIGWRGNAMYINAEPPVVLGIRNAQIVRQATGSGWMRS